MALPTASTGQMTLTATDVTSLGYVSLANFLKNKPIDQVAQQRPLLKALMAKKKPYGGGSGGAAGKTIVEQVRTTYGSNEFKWFGDVGLATGDTVAYAVKDTTRQVYFPWNSAHDGFKFSEDYLLGNGILIGDSQNPRNSGDASLVQLTNVFNEAMETLRLGFEEMLDLSLHLDGQYNPGSTAMTPNAAINGLDYIVNMNPSALGIAGIAFGETWWHNHFDYGLGLDISGAVPAAKGYPNATLVNAMQDMWRSCQKNGGSPNFLLAGTDFIKGYELASATAMSRYAVQPGSMSAPWNFDPSLEIKDMGTFTGLFFNGVPIIWDPTFDQCTVKDGGSSMNKIVPWTNRCYMLNMNHLFLRPIEGNDMIARKPPREHTSYNYYWGMTWRGALTANRRNCHGVISASGA